MIWWLYNILFGIGFVLVLPYYLLRMKRRGGYAAHFWQRVGQYEPEVLKKLKAGPRIWLHAVSVGETFIALKLMEELRAKTDQGFVLTVNTSTAHAIARDALRPEEVLLYFPADFPPIIRKVLKTIKPSALVIMECELWPNLIRHAAHRGIPVALVNARISDHSYRGYKKLSYFTRRLLPLINLICAQSEADAKRLISLGAREEVIHLLSSAKYDVADADEEPAEKMFAVLASVGFGKDKTILLGGSTWEGEEEALLNCYTLLRETHKNLSLVLVPRHAERRDDVVQCIKTAGFRPVLRSTLDETPFSPGASDDQVLLVDTTGELRGLYACADLIFVGKSLTNHGGQNILEAAAFAKAVVVGPNMENFPVITQDFLAAEALVQVADEAGLHDALDNLLGDPEKRTMLGQKARGVIASKRGAMKTTAEDLVQLLQKR